MAANPSAAASVTASTASTACGVPMTDSGPDMLALSGSSTYSSNAYQACFRIGPGVFNLMPRAGVVTNGSSEPVTNWQVVISMPRSTATVSFGNTAGLAAVSGAYVHDLGSNVLFVPTWSNASISAGGSQRSVRAEQSQAASGLGEP